MYHIIVMKVGQLHPAAVFEADHFDCKMNRPILDAGFGGSLKRPSILRAWCGFEKFEDYIEDAPFKILGQEDFDFSDCNKEMTLEELEQDRKARLRARREQHLEDSGDCFCKSCAHC